MYIYVCITNFDIFHIRNRTYITVHKAWKSGFELNKVSV